MRYLTTLSLTFFAISALAGPKEVVEFRYVGLSDWEDDGIFEYANLQGIAAMNRACADTYGDGAKAASIAEALFKNDRSLRGDQDTRSAWVVPGGPMLVAETLVGQFQAVDAATGAPVGNAQPDAYRALAYAYCQRFTNDALNPFTGIVNGPVISGQTTGILFGGCNNSYPVACSGPVALPLIR